MGSTVLILLEYNVRSHIYCQTHVPFWSNIVQIRCIYIITSRNLLRLDSLCIGTPSSERFQDYCINMNIKDCMFTHKGSALKVIPTCAITHFFLIQHSHTYVLYSFISNQCIISVRRLASYQPGAIHCICSHYVCQLVVKSLFVCFFRQKLQYYIIFFVNTFMLIKIIQTLCAIL